MINSAFFEQTSTTSMESVRYIVCHLLLPSFSSSQQNFFGPTVIFHSMVKNLSQQPFFTVKMAKISSQQSFLTVTMAKPKVFFNSQNGEILSLLPSEPTDSERPAYDSPTSVGVYRVSTCCHHPHYSYCYSPLPGELSQLEHSCY